MKLLLDENISRDLKNLFLTEDFDVLDLKDKSLRQLPDKQVFKLAKKEKRLIITHDRDYLPFMLDPLSKVKIVLLSINPQTEERMIAAGKFLIASGVFYSLKKSAILYYIGEEISFSNI